MIFIEYAFLEYDAMSHIPSKLTKTIPEVKYLAAENAWRYRPIMRFFYRQYEKLKYWMYKEEVWEELRQYQEFSGYTPEQCQLDLEALVEWGNLSPMQDTTKAATVAEFKNKQFRYQMTEYAVEIERLSVTLENLRVEGASLEPTLIERIRDTLRQLPSIADADSKTVGSWWRELNTYFKTLNQNYQDYIRSFHSMRAEELMKTTAFLVYKDAIIEYLREFVKGLQTHSHYIELVFRDIAPDAVETMFTKALEYEKSIPRLEIASDAELLANIEGRWDSIRQWFIGSEQRESEVYKLFDLTNELIRKITRYAAQIVESRNSAANRKEEYRKLCELFLECSALENCHLFSSLVFGVFHSRHLQGNLERSTESINSSVYAEKPLFVEVRLLNRNSREKIAKNPIRDQSVAKQRVYEAHLHAVKKEREIIQGYIQDRILDFNILPVIPSYVRTTLLRWVAKACASPQKTAKTEDGKVFRLVFPPDNARCYLRSEDGDLEMPAYRLEFMDAISAIPGGENLR